MVASAIHADVPFTQGIGFRTPMGIQLEPTGKVVAYVHDDGMTNFSGYRPPGLSSIYTTLNAALAQSRGAGYHDVIVVLPGHAESPSAAITLDVAGVWVLGLGWGNDRPTVTSSNATNAVAMTAASCRLSNILFVLGVATTTHAINVTGAACIVEDTE